MNTQIKNDRAAWLQGPSAQCSPLPSETQTPWRLILLGAPGVGKGTQAELLHHRLGACHLSTGDVFRGAAGRNTCEQSPAMKVALEFMRRGELVPDSTVWGMVKERCGCIRCQGGFILDGFPRTIAQADALKSLMEQEKIPLDAVIDYELPCTEIIARISGRRTCKNCSRSRNHDRS
jgi:adenylate kinase